MKININNIWIASAFSIFLLIDSLAIYHLFIGELTWAVFEIVVAYTFFSVNYLIRRLLDGTKYEKIILRDLIFNR